MSICSKNLMHAVCATTGVRTVLAVLLICIAHSSFAADTTSDGDQALKDAAAVKQEIAQKEREISRLQLAMISRIESSVAKIDSEKFDGVDNVVKCLRPLVHQLNVTSKQLLANQEMYFESLRGLHKAVRDSPVAYRAAAEAFDSYAAEEPYEEIKKDYAALADSWRMIADEMEKRAKAIQGQGRDAVEFKKHLERTSLFLERLETHLASFPELSSLSPSDDNQAALLRYIQGFEALRSSLRTFHEKLKAVAPPAPVGRQASSVASTRYRGDRYPW